MNKYDLTFGDILYGVVVTLALLGLYVFVLSLTVGSARAAEREIYTLVICPVSGECFQRPPTIAGQVFVFSTLKECEWVRAINSRGAWGNASVECWKKTVVPTWEPIR